MKTEIKTLVLKMHPIDKVSVFDEETTEEQPSYDIEIPTNEIIEFLSELNRDNYKCVEIIGFRQQAVYTEDEMQELQDENDTLKDKLDNAWNYIDNIEEHLNDLRDNISYALGDLDEAEEDTQYAKDECEHE